jgi:hypothetical protein
VDSFPDRVMIDVCVRYRPGIAINNVILPFVAPSINLVRFVHLVELQLPKLMNAKLVLPPKKLGENQKGR